MSERRVTELRSEFGRGGGLGRQRGVKDRELGFQDMLGQVDPERRLHSGQNRTVESTKCRTHKCEAESLEQRSGESGIVQSQTLLMVWGLKIDKYYIRAAQQHSQSTVATRDWNRVAWSTNRGGESKSQ